MTYRIKDWDVHYENHDSRKVKSVRWVALPNKHDGKGYRRVAAHRDAIAVMCAWPLIVQVASKMPERGVLADEDGPLDSSDLAVMTGFPAEIFDKAFKLLVANKICWLEVVPSEVESSDTSREFPQSPDETGEFPLVGKGRLRRPKETHSERIKTYPGAVDSRH